jgi:hypothetical protein
MIRRASSTHLPAAAITLDGDRMEFTGGEPDDGSDGGLGRGEATIAELDADGRPGTPASVRDRLTGLG